jgi:hypothetical protein
MFTNVSLLHPLAVALIVKSVDCGDPVLLNKVPVMGEPVPLAGIPVALPVLVLVQV